MLAYQGTDHGRRRAVRAFDYRLAKGTTANCRACDWSR